MQPVPEHFYIQSAVIPFRQRDGELEILLITSRKKKRWVIPKGVKEPELALQASAVKEAMEEAGVEGPVFARSIGTYRYRKWEGVCTVDVYAMAVEKMHPVWDEDYRDRDWVTLTEAVSRLEEPELRRIVGSLPDFLRTP
jgi:8-oxo-dGTP pyrophosphatase MutT (NUDIX family)